MKISGLLNPTDGGAHKARHVAPGETRVSTFAPAVAVAPSVLESGSKENRGADTELTAQEDTQWKQDGYHGEVAPLNTEGRARLILETDLPDLPSAGASTQWVHGAGARERFSTPVMAHSNAEKVEQKLPGAAASAIQQEESPRFHNQGSSSTTATLSHSTPSNTPSTQRSSLEHDKHHDNEDAVDHDYDTELGDDDGTSSIYDSLFSSATNYYWENGRRYHAHRSGHYMLPNDETELDREDMKHHEWLLITDFRLHLSPIPPNPTRILDLGTGTGIWAMQVAETYPSCSVMGTDISPVQPKHVPPNLSFEVDDLEQEWLYRPSTYDLINIRFMFLAIKDWAAVLKQAYQTLKPGAYIELSELELSPTTIPPLSPEYPNVPQPLLVWQWLSSLDDAARRSGFDMHISRHFKTLLEDAGFVDIVETRFEVPWGSWPQNKRLQMIGFWHLEQLKQGLQGIVMAFFTRALGWAVEDVESLLVGLRRELDDGRFRIMDHAVVVYGRKPLEV